MADYKRIWFGSIASVANPTTNLPLGTPFGADNGPGFGVKDVDVIKLGLEWRRSPAADAARRLLLQHGADRRADADLNIMTLGIVQHHITGGLNTS